MRVVIQRVVTASVKVDGAAVANIGNGLLILVGIEDTDNDEDVEWLTKKIIGLRIFDDKQQVPNLSINDIRGEILLVSQFTLHASTKKGNRPSYLKASKGDVALPIFNQLFEAVQKDCNNSVHKGIFGADMKVQLVNDGPVTIIIDSKIKE